MKLKAIILICCLILTLLFAGCTNKSETVPSEQAQEKSDISDVSSDTVDDTETGGETELLAPVTEWWELYNPNGFDTLTAVISNPNDIAVDVSYDIVFYKDGAEVSRIEYCDNFSILPNGRDIIWVNADVPSADEADDVKLENIFVSKSAYPPINGSYEYAGITDGEACFDFTFDSKPTLASIRFLLYNDNNSNGQFDKGEIVVTSTASLTEQTGRVSFDTNVYSYTNYEVFFTAY